MERITEAFTHAGKFHADDVFSAALLRIMYPGIRISRGNAVPEGYQGLVFDIGYGEFDHHQPDSPVRENGIPYAAFGLLWRKFGKDILGEDAGTFEKEFVEGLDDSDNGGTISPIASLINDFNGQWDLPETQDGQFEKAAAFAEMILRNKFRVYQSQKRALDLVYKAVAQSEEGIVILPKAVPWRKVRFDEQLYYVIYPSPRGGFNAQCIPVRPDSFENRRSFPEEWRGLSDEKLETISGIQGLHFCHKNGFLVAGSDLESVREACRKALGKR